MKSLKHSVTFILIGLTLLGSAQQPFTAGNIVVYRVGDGSAPLTVSVTKVYLDEYNPVTNALVQSILMPIAASGTNNILTARGDQPTDGMLNLSADGKYLIVPGINTAPGGSGSTAGVIGLVDFNGTINTSTAVTDFTLPLSAISDNGNRLWFGGAGGLRYTTAGSNTSISIANVGSTQDFKIADGQLYANTVSSSANGVYAIGNGLPTTTGQTVSMLPGLTGPGLPGLLPNQFAFADMDPNVPGVDVLYIADQVGLSASTDGGLKKYSLVGGIWTANGKITTGTNSIDRYTGLTLRVSANAVNLYWTRRGPNSTAVRGGQLVTLMDNSGYNGTLAGTPVVIATAATANYMAFRGVARVPQGCPPVGGLQALNITSNRATISWNAVGANYEYAVTTDPTIPPTSWNSISNNSITSTGLSNSLTYYAHVRNVCSGVSKSEWSTIMFVTSCKPPSAPLLTISISGIGVVTIKWNQVYGATSYEYFISTNPATPSSGTTVNDTSVSLTNLNPISQYYVYVRSNCGGGAFSNWVSKIFTTACFMPAIHVSLLANHAGATWNKINNVVKYEYALTHTAAKPLSGNNTTDTFYIMDKLKDGSANYFHVRSICNTGAVSDWGTVAFQIQGMQIWPNPIGESLSINLNGLGNTNGWISISDAMGRVVKQMRFTGNSVIVNTRAWAAGVYIVSYDDGQHKYTVKAMKQ